MTQPCSPHLYNALSYRQRFAAGFVALLFASALTACGGGGSGGGGAGAGVSSYKGKTEPADITTENYESLGDAAAQGSGAAIEEEEASDNVPSAATIITTQVTLSDERREWLAGLHQQVIDQAGGLPETSLAANIKVPGDCGGNAVVSFNPNNADTITTKYNNFCAGDEGDQSIINGTARITTTNTVTEIHYQNFTISSGGEVSRINNMTIRCVDNGSSTTCTTSSDFIGANGVTYRMEEVDVTDNGASYDVSATIYHPEHGYVTFTATGLVPCAEGGFSSGTITVESTETPDESIRVTFSSCVDAPTIQRLFL